MAILQADTRDDPQIDWEDPLSAKDGYPVLALIAILAAIVFIGIAADRIDTLRGAAYVLGATFGPALLMWGIGYAVTIRHASPAWRIGTLGIVLLVAALHFIAVMSSTSRAAKRDIAMIADTRIDENGLFVLPPDADRGPASRVFIAHFTAMNAAIRDRRRLVDTTGLDGFASAQAVQRNPAQLRDCARFDRARGQSDAIVDRLIALTSVLPGKLERTGIEPMARRQMLDGMSVGVSSAQPKLRAAGARLNALFAEAQGMCTLLARRNWRARGPAFVFTSTADLRAFDRHSVAFNRLIEQDQAAEAEMRRAAAANRAQIAAAAR